MPMWSTFNYTFSSLSQSITVGTSLSIAIKSNSSYFPLAYKGYYLKPHNHTARQGFFPSKPESF